MQKKTSMLKSQKELIKESIVAPTLECILENCNRQQIVLLIDEAKEGQIGRKKLVELYGKHDPEMLDALNGISRIYEDPHKVFFTTFGSLTPSNNILIETTDEIINELLDLYYPKEEIVQPNQNNALEVMTKIREKLINVKNAFGDESIVKEIMNLKKLAGLVNIGGRNQDYSRGLNLSNLDLSNFDFSNCQFKSVNFTNSNLSNTNFFKSSLVRCIFNNCNLENTNFTSANLIGEEVSFKNASVRNAKFIDIKIEQGTTQRELQGPEAIKNEIKARGACFTEEAIFTKIIQVNNNNNENLFFNQQRELNPPQEKPKEEGKKCTIF